MMYFVITLVYAFVFAYATQTINENKGYEGGFWLGFWLGVIGLIIVACKPEKNNYYATYLATSSLTKEDYEKRTLSNGGWKCTRCGRVNFSYDSSCACGMSKFDNKAILNQGRKAVEEQNTKDNNQTELDNIRKIKEYKELLDLGIITSEEFEKKKKELLNI